MVAICHYLGKFYLWSLEEPGALHLRGNVLSVVGRHHFEVDCLVLLMRGLPSTLAVFPQLFLEVSSVEPLLEYFSICMSRVIRCCFAYDSLHVTGCRSLILSSVV
jgi:hypothetical protein